MQRLLLFVTLSFIWAGSALGAALMSPADVVQAVAHLDAAPGGQLGAWAKQPAYSRFFTKSFIADRDMMWSKQGDWLDADELTGNQGTEGLVITRVRTTTYPKPNQAIVVADVHEHEAGGAWLPMSIATFTLVRESGIWKVDEVSTPMPSDTKESTYAVHAFYRHMQMGFWWCGPTECSKPDWIIQAFEDAIQNCKSDDVEKHDKACGIMKPIAARLRAHGYCYGKKGEAGYEMTWSTCGPDSVRN